VTAGNGSTDQPAAAERIIERIIERPLRRRLPDTRRSITHKFNVAGHEGYLTVGLYDDGAPGELFISMAKEGSTIGGVMDSLGTAISVALQYGVPVESLVNKFTHQRFEPAGMTHNPDIPFAKSLVDYIFRWMGMEFVPGYRAANAPRRSSNRTDEAAHRTAARDRASEIVSHARASSNGQGSDGSSHVDAAQFKRNLGHGEEADDASPMGRASQGSPARRPRAAVAESSDAVMLQMTQMQADAPACDVCGTITVRSGTCYKCINCGNSMGCS
jgi:ribonucleoside-diphosphate reductase alpha chain